MELANQATFTQLELDAYQKVQDEIRQVFEIAAYREALGKAEGKAEAILDILVFRGIAISADARQRIESCKDVPTLRLWTARAVTAGSTEELFGAQLPSSGPMA